MDDFDFEQFEDAETEATHNVFSDYGYDPYSTPVDRLIDDRASPMCYAMAAAMEGY